ncbi:hypothetical protein [Phenylobacterium sp.]|uniref:hypothetical protein n=1 Tax=Phenylobacterium sp. TaxID=1871053 RepID=UPI0039190826
MIKISILAGTLAGLMAGTPAAAQIISFNSVPTSNTCPYPWAITLQPQPPIQTLAPGAATVLNRNVNGLQTPFGPFAAPPSRTIHPGYFCFFENCTAGVSITLTCATVAGAKAPTAAEIRASQDKFSLTFKAKGSAQRK